MNGTAPRIAVIVPTRGPLPSALLDDCLASLRAQSLRAPDDVVVVLDGLPLPENAAAGSRGTVRYTTTPTRGGFAAAVNAGWAFHRATHPEDRADLVLVLNDDTVLDPGCLDALRHAAARHPDVAILSPQILYPGAAPLLWWAGGSYSLRLGVPRHIGRGRRPGPRDAHERPIDFATGCALMIRAEAFDALGGFTEDYFAYGEDVDLSLRARARGMRLLYVPDARLVHRVNEPADRNEAEPWRLRLATANLLRVLRRHASVLQWTTALPYILVRWVGALGLVLLLRGEGRSSLAPVAGLLDFVRSPDRAVK